MINKPKNKTAQIIDGKKIAGERLIELRKKILLLKRTPGLAAILIGDDPASHLYLRNKKRACEKVGIIFHDYLCGKKCLPNITEPEILAMIDWLNKDKEIDGIIVQLPLPKNFNTQTIINHIDPKKDVDGFHPENIKNFSNYSDFPTSPLIESIRVAIKSTGQDVRGKQALIIGKNPIFYENLAQALKKEKLIVTQISDQEKLLTEKIKTADVLIVILGKSNFIKKSMIKEGAIVIDVGTNLISENKWAGDVEPQATEVAGFITPVPGGIGPLTVAMLLENTYQLAKKNQ